MQEGAGSVKSYAQNRFWSLVEIYYRGRLKRSLVTFQQAGRKGSRAAVRRLPCPLASCLLNVTKGLPQICFLQQAHFIWERAGEEYSQL